MQAAYEEGKILLNRRKIENVIADKKSSEEERQKLKLVLEARNYAFKLGLNPKESFTKYTKLNRDVLAYVLLASKKDSFSLYTWWYPIVGTVPYHGYFDLEDARADAKELEEQGFEIWLRPTEAFSTLGWFNDPVLSTTLQNEPLRIVNTVIHESFHTTLWFPNQVIFNESVANFIGLRGAWDFYRDKFRACPSTDTDCIKEAGPAFAEARRQYELELELATVIEALYSDLEALYQSDLSSEAKLSKREELFNKHVAPFRKRYPTLRILKSINNAEIMQLKLYLTELDTLAQHFKNHHYRWKPFIESFKALAKEDLKPEDDIFKRLTQGDAS